MSTRSRSSQPQTHWLVPVFATLLTRSVLQELLAAAGVHLYWRTLTPLVTLWGMIYQRLLGRGTLDDVVAALHAGAADGLDPDDPHPQPLSQRLRAVSTSAYQQARQRLPLGVIHALRVRLTQAGRRAVGAEGWTWHGHPVRLLDGTTFRLPPAGDLEATYGRAGGACGPAHWVTAQSVATFGWRTGLVGQHAESAHVPSETTLVRPVLTGEPVGALVVADMAFGIYRVAQVAHALAMEVLVRLDPRHVPTLLGDPGGRLPAVPQGAACCQWPLQWAYRPRLACDPTLPRATVPGRILCARLVQPGFRPRTLYLFTTLTDERHAPAAELIALYAERWQVELRYRELKATLHLDYFDVRSSAMFVKELEVGLLTYTLIRLALLDAAPQVGAALRLSFAAAARRLREAWPCPARWPRAW